MSTSLVKYEEISPRKDGDLTPKYTSQLSVDDVMFQIAWQLSFQGTCPRRSVGCVLVDPKSGIVSTGWNGAPEPVPSCLEQECIIEGGHCVRAVHAEMRAVADAARRGTSLDGCVAYCTLLPCIQCMQLMFTAGIRIINYDESYQRSERNHLHRLAVMAGIVLKERSRE